MSLTTVGHAETGRTWQSREFWRLAGQALGDGGELLRAYDRYQAGGHAPAPEAAGTAVPGEPAPPVPVLPVSVTITPGGVLVTWPDGTETLARPPGGQHLPGTRTLFSAVSGGRNRDRGERNCAGQGAGTLLEGKSASADSAAAPRAQARPRTHRSRPG